MKLLKCIVYGMFLGLMACETSEDGGQAGLKIKGKSGLSYEDSFRTWRELKQRNGNSYTYQTSFGSWTGFGTTTRLTVIEGKVASRAYEEYQSQNDSSGTVRTILDSYTEDKNDLGTHQKGAPLHTIDDLYTSCVGEYLIVNSTENTVYFETLDNGILSLCGYVPKDCADDCFRGVRIDSFEWNVN